MWTHLKNIRFQNPLMAEFRVSSCQTIVGITNFDKFLSETRKATGYAIRQWNELSWTNISRTRWPVRIQCI